MSKEIIKSIEINIGDTTVKVTPKQAAELHEALGALLNVQPKVVERQVERHIHHHDRTPYIWPYYQPIWTGGTAGTSPDANKWTITYAAQSQSAVMKIQ